jgi:hypothetical protein
MRRLVKPEKYNNKQLLDVINNTPVTTPTASSFIMLPTAKIVATPKTTTDTDTFTTGGSTSHNDSAAINTHKTSASLCRCANGNSTINTKGKSTIAIANANIKARCGR